jgi:hypothetical protein
MDVNDRLPLTDTTYNIPDAVQPIKKKGGDPSKVIIIPVETADFITGKAHCAFVTTRSEEELDDSLICDGGSTCTLTKRLENCTLCKPKVVVIQTANESTMMKSTYHDDRCANPRIYFGSFHAPNPYEIPRN